MHVLGNTGAVILDGDLQPAGGQGARAEPDVLAMGGGVAGQIGQGALEGQRTQGGGQIGGGDDLDLGSGPADVLGGGREQIGDRHRLSGLAGLAAGEGEVFVDHMLHLVEIALHRLGALERRSQRQFEAQPGQGGAQVVADRGEQGGALVDMALNPLPHGEEGVGGGADLARAMRFEMLARLAPAEGFGCVGQSFYGAHLVADEQDGDAHQQDGGDGQPEDEDVGLGGHSALARGDDPKHALGLLDADVDVGGIAGGVEPEGLVDTGGEGLLEGAIDHADGAAPVFLRQDVALAQLDRQ